MGQLAGSMLSSTASGRLRFWEPFTGLAGGSAGFVITSAATQLTFVTFTQPIRFQNVHVYIYTTEGSCTIQPSLWAHDGTTLTRIVAGTATQVGSSGAVQAFDLGAMQSPVVGKEYAIGLRVVTAGTLRLLTGSNTAAISMQITQATPFGRIRQRSASLAADTSYVVGDLAAALGNPAIWFGLVDGV